VTYTVVILLVISIIGAILFLPHPGLTPPARAELVREIGKILLGTGLGLFVYVIAFSPEVVRVFPH
jgi:hypothetical protein